MIRFLFSLNIVWSIICLALYLVQGTNPNEYWVFSIASLIIPASIIINFILILFWLIFHIRYAWLPALIILFGYSQLNKLIAWNSDSKEKECKQSKNFEIMSFNVYGLKNLKDTSDQSFIKNKAQFFTFLRTNNPDILCVQENNLFADDVINKAEIFPYVHYMINHGAAIYSKFPFLDQGLIDFGTNTNSCLWADVLIEGRRLRIYSVHMQSNSISKQVVQLKDEEEVENIEKFNVVKQMLRKYRKMSIRRANQADLIQNHALSSPYPVIIAGDLNDTPYSYSYKVLSNDRLDSFLERGNGFGSTLVGILPGLRIDYLLADKKKINFCIHRILQTSFSDHNPILANAYFK
ncbi:MAG: endonuclease/exonuclease/phosphatase family protein [Saprospiraceae bacterium]